MAQMPQEFLIIWGQRLIRADYGRRKNHYQAKDHQQGDNHEQLTASDAEGAIGNLDLFRAGPEEIRRDHAFTRLETISLKASPLWM